MADRHNPPGFREEKRYLIEGFHSVPFVDMQAVNDPIREELRAAFERVLSSGSFINGREVASFEAALAARVGTRFALGVSSGTSALQLILEAAGIGAGDEVILPANTFFATAEAVISAGAEPVLVDPLLETALIDPRAVEAAITPRTAAVIAVHLYGQPADMDALHVITSSHGLALIEDAAQAIGATWRERPAGSLALAAGFSFYPAKNLGALGDAGAVTTSDASIATRVEQLRNHGSASKYVHHSWGYNHRMDELQAAFLAAKLPRLQGAQDARDRSATRYHEALVGLSGVGTFDIDPRARHVHHLMAVTVRDRDFVVEELHRLGIDAGVHYPCPIHLQPAWAGRTQRAALPRAEKLANSVLSLPIYPGISDADVDRCVDLLGSVLRAGVTSG